MVSPVVPFADPLSCKGQLAGSSRPWPAGPWRLLRPQRAGPYGERHTSLASPYAILA
eukprot:COSAG01_NODE_2685_length_7253_cov_6.363153_9_plen_57_part_00